MPRFGTSRLSILPKALAEEREMGKILIRQKRSLIGQPQKMRRVVRALGLRRIRHSVVKKDTNCIRGMINKANHLLEYELERESGKDARGIS